MAEWAAGFVVAVMAGQDFVADSFTLGLGDTTATTAATIQGTDSSSDLAIHTGLITVQDGRILTTVTPTTILIRFTRTRTLIRIQITTPDMLTPHPTQPPARKRMENRFI